MDKQLLWITKILHENNIKYWIDMGTLLALIRDGKLMKHDRDIDISLWTEDADKLEKLFPRIKQEGYRIQVVRYKNYKFMYKFTHQNKKLRVFDIKVYYKADNLFAWSPQPRFFRKKSIFYKLIAKIIGSLWFPIATKLSIDKFPLSIISEPITWWIPARYFNQIILLKKYEVFIPKKYKEYLELHYGNWRVPVERWDFIIDDKALKYKTPEELIETLR